MSRKKAPPKRLKVRDLPAERAPRGGVRVNNLANLEALKAGTDIIANGMEILG